KMFLTRMGHNTKMIITGDSTQIDLPRSTRSGLLDALEILKNVSGIGFVEMTDKDIVRHKLVTKIVNAYNEYEENLKLRKIVHYQESLDAPENKE
ncbi:MAG: PhoH family protein, partial [Bacteroidaceae bacterium]|nr:PhoH family protein [Bacteroidaceae bacterium]